MNVKVMNIIKQSLYIYYILVNKIQSQAEEIFPGYFIAFVMLLNIHCNFYIEMGKHLTC